MEPTKQSAVSLAELKVKYALKDSENATTQDEYILSQALLKAVEALRFCADIARGLRKDEVVYIPKEEDAIERAREVLRELGGDSNR